MYYLEDDWCVSDIYADPSLECKDCVEKDTVLDMCKKLTYGMLFMMHGRHDINVHAVDDLMGELCDCLNIKLPPPNEEGIYECAGEDS